MNLVAFPRAPLTPSRSSSSLSTLRFLGPDIKKTAGDASKAAREVRKIAYDETVGLRVPLGLDAINAITSQVVAVQKDVEAAGKWSGDLKQD